MIDFFSGKNKEVGEYIYEGNWNIGKILWKYLAENFFESKFNTIFSFANKNYPNKTIATRMFLLLQFDKKLYVQIY